MGLVGAVAPYVLLCGHGSSTTNNPYGSALDCGACGGYAGDVNARAAAALLNDPAVRDGFNTAVAMYHSFWFPEAIKAFQAVSQKDPSCAMAYWGIAMSQWGNPYGGIKNAEIVKLGSATGD